MTRRTALLALAGLLAAALAFAADLLQGAGDVPAGDVLGAVLAPGGSLADAIVRDVRLPRAAAGLLAGGALAAAAVLLHAATRNRLAEAGTFGLNAGGALAVTAVAAFASLAPGAPTILVAFAGVLGAGALVVALAATSGAGSLRVVLAGMAVTLALSAVAAAIQLVRETETSGLYLWGAGTLVQAGWGQVRPAAPLFALALLLALPLARQLDVAALGDDAARALGSRAQLVRLLALALAALFAAVAVAVAGPIAFVGVLAGQLAGAARPRTTAQRLLVAVPWGAALVLAADVLARLAFGAGNETPVGVVCALLGAPLLIVLARRVEDDDAAAFGEAGAGGMRAASPRRRRALLVVLAVALPAVALASLCVGEVNVAPRAMLGALTGAGDPLAELVLELNAPRLVVALAAGAALACAGTLLQTALRNPFASPELVGVTGGASVATFAVLIAAPGVATGVLPLVAFAGGLAALLLVLAVAGATPGRVVLAGLALTAACAAVVTLLVLHAQQTLGAALTWLAGSTYAETWRDVAIVGLPALVLLPLALLAARRLDVLALGDDLATALGERVGPLRVGLLVLAALLAGAAVAVAGAIAFVGLLAPHAARLVAGGEHRRLLPAAMALGAGLLALADVVGRTVLAPTEIPSGLVVALVGAPYMAWIMWRTRAV